MLRSGLGVPANIARSEDAWQSGIEMLRENTADDRLRVPRCGSHVLSTGIRQDGSNCCRSQRLYSEPLELAKFSEDLDSICVACCRVSFLVSSFKFLLR